MRPNCLHLLICGCILLSGCRGVEAPASADAPSIVLISLDTCRADLFGPRPGGAPSLTPNLDAFAADAVAFSSAYVQVPHTLPSHMSMLTSLSPDAHGVRPEARTLPDAVVTLPEVLARNGYRTVGVVTSEWLDPQFGFGRGFDRYERLRHRLTYAGRVTDTAIRRIASSRRPVFAFLHLYDLHSDFDNGLARNRFPYYSVPTARRHLDVSRDGREFCDDQGRCNTAYLIAADSDRRDLPAREIDLLRELYRAAMPLVDARLGRFFDRLRDLGLYDASLIVVTSDHGEEFHEHGRFIHSQPYDETARVPLLVKLPGNAYAGARVEDPVESLDLMPTVLDLVGLPVPEGLQGASLRRVLEGGDADPDDAVLCQDSLDPDRYALRTAAYTLVLQLGASRRELYDHRTDPGETVDVARQLPEIADRLEARLRMRVRRDRALHDELGGTAGGSAEVLSQEERERLKALGYVD